MALALGEDRDQHVGPGHLGAVGALDVDRGALDHALEAGGGGGFGALDVGDERVEFVVEKRDDGLAERLESTPQAFITRAASGSSIRARSRCSRVASSCLR